MTYPGGKNGAGIYQRIINHMPPHKTYIEAFLGSGAVLRNKRLCQKHWGTVPRATRALYNKARRRYERDATGKNRKAVGRLWIKCKAYAINEELGIGNA